VVHLFLSSCLFSTINCRQLIYVDQAHIQSVPIENCCSYMPTHICTGALYPSTIKVMRKRQKHRCVFPHMPLQVCAIVSKQKLSLSVEIKNHFGKECAFKMSVLVKSGDKDTHWYHYECHLKITIWNSTAGSFLRNIHICMNVVFNQSPEWNNLNFDILIKRQQ
jgi:hypothetical protein